MKSIRLRVFLLALLLMAITFALFFPATSFSLVNFDDPVFIIHNPILFNGFSGSALRSAFTGLHGDECMYVPLLWVSYLLDLKFFNASPVNPWGFHFSNVLLHALNSALLFLLLFALCKKPWRAFFFAALWALHPLRVESVAWVTSRKDVLSTFFALLSVGAYVWAGTRRPGAERPDESPSPHLPHRLSRPVYAASFVFFLLGLLVKPMLVTIPGLMLLLDFWPLRRYGSTGPAAARAAPRLLLEKLLFFLCAGLASLVVYLTQTNAMGSAPLWFRLYYVPSNYLFYLAKSFLPFQLSAMVPRGPVPLPSLLLALGILAAASAWAWTRRREHPNELVGWLAFLGLLFPVIGIVLIGIYPVAERYSYLPSIGLSVALLFLIRSGQRRSPDRLFRAGRVGLALIILAALAALTSRHLPSWRNNQSLYDNVARRHPGHYAAIYYQAQQEFFVKGNAAAADRMADQLLEIKPATSFGLVLKIVCLSQLQSTEAALEFAQAHYPPVDVLTNPGIYENYLAILALLARQYDQANQYMEETFRQSVFEPKSQEQLHALAMLLAHEQGDEATALAHAARISALQRKTQLAPEDFFLAYTTIWAAGLYAQTLPRFQELARTYPDRPDLLNNVAWLLATTAGSPAAPEEILGMVRQALANAPRHPVILDTLAVALANAGEFDEALRTAQQLASVLAISPAADAPDMLRKVQKRIALYRECQPYREDSSGRLLYAL
jgi:protein O-mannosyl-transferase